MYVHASMRTIHTHKLCFYVYVIGFACIFIGICLYMHMPIPIHILMHIHIYSYVYTLHAGGLDLGHEAGTDRTDKTDSGIHVETETTGGGMYVYGHICVFIPGHHVHTHTHVYSIQAYCTYVCIYIYVCVCAYVCMYLYIHTYNTCIHTQKTYDIMCVRVLKHVCVHVCICTYI
jgi:hypothetical protein